MLYIEANCPITDTCVNWRLSLNKYKQYMLQFCTSQFSYH